MSKKDGLYGKMTRVSVHFGSEMVPQWHDFRGSKYGQFFPSSGQAEFSSGQSLHTVPHPPLLVSTLVAHVGPKPQKEPARESATLT